MKIPPFSVLALSAVLAFPALFVIGESLHAKERKPLTTAPADAPPAPAGRRLVGPQSDGSVLVTTNQMLTPLGKVQQVAGERTQDLAVSPDGSLIAVQTTASVLFYKADGALEATVPVKPSSLGLAWHPDGQSLFCSGRGGTVYRLAKVKGV